MSGLLQRGSNGLRRRKAATGLLYRANLDGSCCCPTTGTCVTITFAGVSIEQPSGADYWVECGDLNGGPYTISVDSAGYLAQTTDGPCGYLINGAGSLFTRISIIGQGIGTDTNFSTSWNAETVTLQIYRCDDGWQISLGVGLNVPGLAVTGAIFSGVAAYDAGGAATVATNDAMGWTGNPRVGVDPESGYNIGNGGTCTIAFYQPCPPSSDDRLCLCDGIDRGTECLDFVVAEIDDGFGVITHQSMIAGDVTAGVEVDPTSFVTRYFFRFIVGLGGTFSIERTDCCDVTGDYVADGGGDTRSVSVLLAANVEVAHCTIHPTAGDVAFNLTRESPTLNEFNGASGGYTCRVYFTDATPGWSIEIKNGGTTVITAVQFGAWSSGGTSFATTYTVTASSIAGIAVSSSITVTT